MEIVTAFGENVVLITGWAVRGSGKDTLATRAARANAVVDFQKDIGLRGGSDGGLLINIPAHYLAVAGDAATGGQLLDDGASFHYFFRFWVWGRVEAAPKRWGRVADQPGVG